MKKINPYSVMIHTIIKELLKAILVGAFLFYFYILAKKAFRIGLELDAYLLSNQWKVNPNYKKFLQKKLLKKFLFSSFDTVKMEQYLSIFIQTNDFKTNLLN